MSYAKPEITTVGITIRTIQGINGKIRFLFVDLNMGSCFYLTTTAGTVCAYQADE